MKKIKYIAAAALAALALSTSAFAVGDIINGVEDGAEDIIDGAGDAADDIIGDGSDATDDIAGDGGDTTDDIIGDSSDTSDDGADDAAGTTADGMNSDIWADESDVTTADITTAAEVTTAPETTTGIVGIVSGDSNVNTGFVLTFTALGAAAAGLTAIAARKRK